MILIFTSHNSESDSQSNTLFTAYIGSANNSIWRSSNNGLWADSYSAGRDESQVQVRVTRYETRLGSRISQGRS